MSKRAKGGLLRRRVRLRQLELLAALERAPTLSAAAREVNLSQPAASKLLNALADDLGVTLFERAGRTLRPTAAGRALLRRSSVLIGDLDRAQDELEAIGEGLIGATTLGAGVGACYALVPRALDHLLEDAPDISVTVREATIDELIGGLREGRFDLVVGRLDNRVADRSILVEELYNPRMTVVCGVKHPLLSKPRPSWSDALRCEWILPEAGTPMRSGVEAVFRRAKSRPARALIESSSIQTNVALLARRPMLWVLSQDIADYFVALGTLKTVPLPRMTGPSPVVYAHMRERALSPAATRVLSALKRASRELR